jgi:hypothetical protein
MSDCWKKLAVMCPRPQPRSESARQAGLNGAWPLHRPSPFVPFLCGSNAKLVRYCVAGFGLRLPLVFGALPAGSSFLTVASVLVAGMSHFSARLRLGTIIYGANCGCDRFVSFWNTAAGIEDLAIRKDLYQTASVPVIVKIGTRGQPPHKRVAKASENGDQPA